MFFDIILLNPQHGRFGTAWIAATIGIKRVTKAKIREVNICKLCKDMELFIVTNSTSPRKRFALRLSAILINGALKLLREQILMLECDIVSFLSTIRKPVYIVSKASGGSGLFETPPTPVPKVKRKRAPKEIVDTPDLVAKTKESEDIFLQLPNLEDVLRPPARTDDICIREEMGRRVESLDDGFGIGVLTGKEFAEEMQLLFSSTQDIIPAVQPQIEPISEPTVPPQCLVEVVAQVHAPKDGIGADENLVPEPRPPQTEPTDAIQVAEVQEQPLESQVLQEILPANQISTVVEKTVPEAQPAVKRTKRKNGRKPVDVLAEILREDPEEQHKTPVTPVAKEGSDKISLERSRLILKKTRPRFVRIDRYKENEGQFTSEDSPLPIPFRNISENSKHLYEMYWYDDDELENIVEIRGNLRSLSGEGSVGMRRTDTPSNQRLTIEEISNTEGVTKPSISLGPQERESSQSALKQLSVEEPSIPLPSPRKRKRITITPDKEITEIQEQAATQKPKSRKQKLAHEEPMDYIQTEAPPQVSEIPAQVSEVTQPQPESEPVQEQSVPIVENVSHVIPPMESPTESDYKLRQQAIVDLVARSIYNLTIEEVCEKPINRLHIARAFSDLIVLAGNNFVLLKTEEDSLELKFIEKGPKLLKV